MMTLRKSRKKTSHFFNKTIKSLKSIFQFHGGQHLHQTTRSSSSSSSRKFDAAGDVCIKQVYYSDRWTDQGNSRGRISGEDKVIVVSTREHGIGVGNECLNKVEERANDKMIAAREEGCLKKHGSCRISQRMKELEMMEFKDVDHVLDVEEVLHYYSRLRSPVYLDIVDSFFTDMYSELHKPQRNCARSFHGSATRVKLA